MPEKPANNNAFYGLPLTELTAISPVDGRYRREIIDIVPFSSEMGLIKTRLEIEAKYLVALSEVGVVRKLTPEEKETLINLGPSLTHEQAERVKEIEDKTRHDVKALEITFRELVQGTSLEDLTEKIHYGLTSYDVDNIAYRLMLRRALDIVLVPTLDGVVDELASRAEADKTTPMLARTHGQPAVGTTIGKEFAIFALRLNKEVRKLEKSKLTGKLNGAVGNYNALALAEKDVDWVTFSENFVKSLGLEPNLVTTQINPYEDMAEVFQTFQRINGIILGFDQDIWRYISDEWFVQQVKKDEVGSSTMPQKVNPIDFENSEGNVQVANGFWDVAVRKLAVSRLQRDLSDSTVLRWIGTNLAAELLGYRRTLAGLKRTKPNVEFIQTKLNEDYVILTEAAQTLLRKAGVSNAYDIVKKIARGQEIKEGEWKDWVSKLDVDSKTKEELMELTPQKYVGKAEELTELALKEIATSRVK